MKIDTKYFGMTEIDEQKMIHFTNGLPGFNEETSFVLIDLAEDSIFQILQSVKTRDIAFVVTNPYHFYKDYAFDLENSIVDSLKIKDAQDVIVLTIVTLKETFSNSTMNLKAPVIINQKKLLGKQYILNDGDYPIKASIVREAIEEVKGEK